MHDYPQPGVFLCSQCNVTQNFSPQYANCIVNPDFCDNYTRGREEELRILVVGL